MIANPAAAVSAVVVSVILSALPTTVAAQHAHEPHVHGVSDMELAIEGNTVEIALESPGADIVGFEHTPGTDAERAEVAKAVEVLSRGAELFVLPARAGCRPTAGEAELEQEDGGSGERHAAFHARYRFECGHIERVDLIEVRLFEYFPGMTEIEARAITARGQFAGELTPAMPRLKL